MEGKLGEHLTLVHPLPLEKKSSVEWLAGLEQAIKFSLASRLTDCLATLPHPLTGEELSSDTIQDVMEWMEGNVEQNILLALDIHWSHRLLESVSDTPRTREIWFALLTVMYQQIPSSLMYRSELKRSLENTVQLLLRQKQTQQQDEQKVLNILRSLVVYLRRKSDFVQSLLSATDLNAMWHLHVHYTTDPTEHQKGVVPSVEESRVSSPAISNIDSNERGSQTPPDPQKVSTQPLSSSLTAGHPYRAGKSPLQISPPTPCFVHAGRCSVVYGFEYYSPAPQIVLTPSMESGVAATISAFAQHSFPCVSGEQNMAIIKEAAKVFFAFICIQISPCLLSGYGQAPLPSHLLSSHNCYVYTSSTAHCTLLWLCPLYGRFSLLANCCAAQDEALPAHTAVCSGYLLHSPIN